MWERHKLGWSGHKYPYGVGRDSRDRLGFFDGNIDLENLENYQNQFILNYKSTVKILQ